MNRAELISLLALDAMADDYESFNQICKGLGEFARDCGVTIGSLEIQQTLATLISAGLAKAYRVSGTSSFEEIHGMPPEEEIDDPWTWYFLITHDGIAKLSLDGEQLPFDDEGYILKGWKFPAN